jgi:hypothetical protein
MKFKLKVILLNSDSVDSGTIVVICHLAIHLVMLP